MSVSVDERSSGEQRRLLCRALREATPLPFKRRWVEECLLDRPGDQVLRRALRDGLGLLSRSEWCGWLPAATGQVAEAVAANILDEVGFSLVWQITTDGLRGIDLILLRPDGNALLAVEVKGALRSDRLPRLGRSRLRQMSTAWLDDPANPGMAEWELAARDIFAMVMVVDLAAHQWRAALSNDLDTYRPVLSVEKLASLSAA